MIVDIIILKYSPGGEYSIINVVVVVVCEHGESPAFKKRKKRR